jgi:hypothetical protein
MNEFERRLRELTDRLTHWWGSGSKNARQRRADRSADLRREASARAQQAASKMQDFRQSERGQKAESTLRDLRTSETAKRAEAKIRDLRASETGQKAENALSDLRQREPVKKAEENARKVMNDLFSGRSGS